MILQSEPDLSQSFDPLRERVAETVSWGIRQTDTTGLATVLRTVAFAPPPAAPWIETVRAVAESRLLRLGRSWRRTLDPLGGGALLLYFPFEPHGTDVSGASTGYFDRWETPPWDTWAAFVEEPTSSYVLTWVPAWAYAQAAAGVALSGGALRWFEESDSALLGPVRSWTGPR